MRGERMKYTKREMIDLIRETVYEVTKVRVDEQESNLLDTRFHIHPADFLYIFDLLEKKLKIPAVNILIGRNYTIMRIDHMSEALIGLIEEK